MIYDKIEDLVGHTPLVHLQRLEKKLQLKGELYAKLEYLNPTGSVKDRAAKQMLLDAIFEGKIQKKTVIIEPTSGNTGIGLAALATAMKLKVMIVMPDTMSQERIKLMRFYGAEVVLTDGAKGMRGAIEKANELAKQYPSSFIPAQFDNPSNPKAHYNSTGPEIVNEISTFDYFVAGVGTGGTITGVGKYLKEHSNAKVIAVEPTKSPILSENKKGAHGIQGIGAGFVPSILNASCYDEVVTVTDEAAILNARLLAKTEGYAVGISSGAALSAAIQICKEENKKIVVLLPDSADRYLSTELFD